MADRLHAGESPTNPLIAMHSLATSSSKAFLTEFRIPDLSFAYSDWEDASVALIWKAMQEKDFRTALTLIREARNAAALGPQNNEHSSLLLAAQAAAEFATGSSDLAKRHAGKSLDLFPSQWMSHRILLSVLAGNHDFKGAYMQLARRRMRPVALWDEALTKVEIHTALGAWSWMLGDWDLVAKHLAKAYPGGIDTMPKEIQEDWFRLSLYRDRPEDAVAVASVLIAEQSIPLADELLQTIVQNGWTKQALPLYRSAYERSPESQLLRRRLVALCIREGALDEARRLTKPGALDLAA